MNWLRIALPVIGIALSAGGVATAQVNDCNAVLRGGTFSYSMMRNNSYYQQIVYTRFLQSTYESSKTDQSLGAGIPLGEMVMGTLSYDQSAYEAKKASIDSTNFQRITQINETQTVLVSGDSAVLNAWTNCIKNGAGGLAVRFELRNAQLATLIIDWFPQGNKYKTKLSSNITIPGVDLRASSDPSCFKKGKKIVQAVGCRSNITLPDAWTPAAVTIAATDGAADAYLPPRIRLITETEPLPPITWYKEYFRNGRSTTSPQTWLLPQAERDSKWAIKTSTVSASVHRDWDNGRSNTNWCANATATATASQIVYQYEYNSAQHGGDGWSFGCTATVLGEKQRVRWIADEEARPTPKAMEAEQLKELNDRERKAG